ncbi:hypothetical protein GW816_01390, partial [Candidatus Wolfebacteria bacterium]|nr:hypothetical protein [Candidatus Wolfebacteria bacterium]
MKKTSKIKTPKKSKLPTGQETEKIPKAKKIKEVETTAAAPKERYFEAVGRRKTA